jgi:antitoxin CptB
MAAPADLNRLRWKCRRGMLELDAWLDGFVDAIYPALDAGQRDCLARLLDEEDPDLYDWICGRGSPPAIYLDMLSRLKEFKVKPT